MRKTLLVLFVLFLVIQGCTIKNEPSDSPEFALGLRPLPSDFLNWWFDNIDLIRDGQFDSDRLPMLKSDIASLQLVILNPVADVSGITTYDLRDHGLVTPPKDQGSNGTCWAFSTAGSLESALLTQLGPTEIANRYPFIPDPSNPDLSEQFIAYYNIDWDVQPSPNSPFWDMFYQETNYDYGGDAFFSTYNLIRRGVPLEADMPYTQEDYDWMPWTATGSDWRQHLIKPEETIVIPFYTYFSYYIDYTTYINTIKSVLYTYGALYVGVSIYKDFQDYWNEWPTNGTVYQHSTGTYLGGHAILLVGWDDNFTDPHYSGPVWILKNSWGTKGGESGYFYLPMITPSEFSGVCPDWKIEARKMCVPVLAP